MKNRIDLERKYKYKQALTFSRACRFLSLVGQSDRDYLSRAWTFFAFSNLELNLLAFIERRIALCLNLRVMNKQVIAAFIRDNKAKSLS
jgi:hypothetical protein